MEGEFKCECVEKLNATLEPLFYYVDRSLMMNLKLGTEAEVMLIPLGRYSAPKGTRRIIMKFCPICGTRTGDKT